ncbi:MAG: hypothetical protein MZV63_06605 [Marinilabiliales bacterium]|nr:hypothetical protein [Marinilabiliales bacterium]
MRKRLTSSRSAYLGVQRDRRIPKVTHQLHAFSVIPHVGGDPAHPYARRASSPREPDRVAGMKLRTSPDTMASNDPISERRVPAAPTSKPYPFIRDSDGALNATNASERSSAVMPAGSDTSRMVWLFERARPATHIQPLTTRWDRQPLAGTRCATGAAPATDISLIQIRSPIFSSVFLNSHP